MVAGHPVQPGVLDGDPGGHGQGDRCGFILRGELGCAVLVGEVQIPVHLAADPHGHAQKRRHRRMTARKSVAVRALRQVGQAQRFRLDDQSAQNAPATRAGSDGKFLVRLQTDREELVEGRAVLAQHPERPVTGVNERTRFTDEVTEDDREAQLSFHHQHRLNEPSELDGIVDLIEWSHRS